MIGLTNFPKINCEVEARRRVLEGLILIRGKIMQRTNLTKIAKGAFFHAWAIGYQKSPSPKIVEKWTYAIALSNKNKTAHIPLNDKGREMVHVLSPKELGKIITLIQQTAEILKIKVSNAKILDAPQYLENGQPVAISIDMDMLQLTKEDFEEMDSGLFVFNLPNYRPELILKWISSLEDVDD